VKLTFLGSFGEPVPPTAPAVGSSIQVDGAVHIGRDASSMIVLRQGPHSDQNAVARRHAIVEPAEGGVRVRDLQSTNGTTIDGVRVTDAIAAVGSTIVIAGFHHFRVDT
jgi:pSer/pThr/pTyr-binding forkhead associated (FHA) protein